METINKKISPTKDRGQAYVRIITGGVNTGKTTKLLSIYRELGLGDGFITSKTYNANRYIGQVIVRLSTGEKEYFSFKKQFIPVNWDEKYNYDIYSFSERGFIFAYNIVTDIIAKKIEPVFIDEIGPLELQKKGFYDLFVMLLRIKKEIFVTVRESCVNNVIKEFGIQKYQMIEI